MTKKVLSLVLAIVLALALCPMAFASTDGVILQDSAGTSLENDGVTLPNVEHNKQLELVFDEAATLNLGSNNAGITLDAVEDLTVGHYDATSVQRSNSNQWTVASSGGKLSNTYAKMFYEVRLKINDICVGTSASADKVKHLDMYLVHAPLGSMPEADLVSGKTYGDGKVGFISFTKNDDGTYQYAGKEGITSRSATTFDNDEWITVRTEINTTTGSDYLKSRMYVNGEPYGDWLTGSSGGPTSALEINTARGKVFLRMNAPAWSTGTDVYVDYVHFWGEDASGTKTFLMQAEDGAGLATTGSGSNANTVVVNTENITDRDPVSLAVSSKNDTTYTLAPAALTVGKTYEVTIPANVGGATVPAAEKKVRFNVIKGQGVVILQDSAGNSLENGGATLPNVERNKQLELVFDEATTLNLGSNNAGITLAAVENLTVSHLEGEGNVRRNGSNYWNLPYSATATTTGYQKMFYEIKLKINEIGVSTTSATATKSLDIYLGHGPLGTMPEGAGAVGRISFTKDGTTFKYAGSDAVSDRPATAFDNNEWVTVRVEINTDKADADNYLKSRMYINGTAYGDWLAGSSAGTGGKDPEINNSREGVKLFMNHPTYANGTDVYVDYAYFWGENEAGEKTYLIQSEDGSGLTKGGNQSSLDAYTVKTISNSEPVSLTVAAKNATTYTLTPAELVIGKTYEVTVPANVNGAGVPAAEKKVKFNAVKVNGEVLLYKVTDAEVNALVDGAYLQTCKVPLKAYFEIGLLDDTTLATGITLNKVEGATLTPVAITPAYDEETGIATIDPGVLEYGATYQLAITDGVKSDTGVALQDPCTITFTVTYQPDVLVTDTAFDADTKTATVTVSSKADGNVAMWVITKVTDATGVKQIKSKAVTVEPGSKAYAGEVVSEYESGDTVDVFVWTANTLMPVMPRSYGLAE